MSPEMATTRGKGSGKDQDAATARLRRLLDSIPAATPVERVEIRTEVRRLADVMAELRALTKVRLNHLTDATAARDRLLAYFTLFVGEVVDGTELQVVGGIQEFARRIRELRVQFGYNISTGYSREDLRPEQYVLESLEADLEAAHKWKTVNTIRRQGGSGRDRVLALLRAFVGRPITGEQLAYVGDIRETARRTRELRRDFGWRIVTKLTGRPDLPAGVYVLESEEQLPEHDRHIPDDVYDQVLERDKYSCRRCGWSLNDRHPAGRRQFLEVHHIIYHHKGGTNDPDNLVTLCNADHDEVHRRKISGPDLLTWIKQGRI